MLGSTARKLRILGFDTIYDSISNDKDLVEVTLSTGRTLLTADHDLYVYTKAVKGNAILVNAKSEKEKLYQVLAKSGVQKISRDSLVSRCSICNGEIADTGTKKQDNENIYSCNNCGKAYWRGSHWRKMKTLFDEVDSELTKKTK